MQYLPFVPTSPPLAGVVEQLFHLEAYRPEHHLERIVPNGRIHLVIELDGHDRHVFDNETREPIQACRGAWLSGIHSKYLTIGDTSRESCLVAIQFAPGRALPVMHTALVGFNDRVVPATDVFSDEITRLREELLALDDGESILARIVTWLEERYDPALEPPEIVTLAVGRLLEAPGDVMLTQFVEDHGSVSYKHFVDLFKKHVGPTPKLMQRILRFARVFERIKGEERVEWAAVSLELGYSDQAHFIRDFRSFSGYRPQRFVEEGHDRLNFFPDDPPESDSR